MRLVSAAIVLNLLVAGSAALVLLDSYRQYEQRAVQATQNLAEVLSHELAGAFGRIDLGVVAVKEAAERDLASGARGGGELDAFIARQLERQPAVDALRIANAEGAIVRGTGVAGYMQFNAAHRAFFTRLRDNAADQLVVSEPILGQISGQWGIVLARRIDRPDGSFGGAAYAVVLLEQFKTRFALLDLGKYGAISLRDLDLGTVVRHPEPRSTGTAIGNRTFSREWPEMLRRNPNAGSYFAVGLDDRRRALSYRRVPGFPFYIIVGQHREDYLAEWRRDLVSIALLVIAFAVTTWLLSRLISVEWKRREENTRRLVELARLREADRERVALDLHDNCIQAIYGIGLALEGGRLRAEADPAGAAKAMGEAQAALNLVIQDLRTFILDETAADDDEPLAARVERIIPSSPPAPRFSVAIDAATATALAPAQRTHVLRIAQEAVSNIVRHARARFASLVLERDGAIVTLRIRDDGVGLPPGAPPDGNAGLGLHHIRARAAKLGGRARVEAAPVCGTQIVVEFPVAPGA